MDQPAKSRGERHVSAWRIESANNIGAAVSAAPRAAVSRRRETAKVARWRGSIFVSAATSIVVGASGDRWST
jgi:hypothetical protein